MNAEKIIQRNKLLLKEAPRRRANVADFYAQERFGDRVKYTRKEYREEYLKSPEWASLRSGVLQNECDCFMCHKKASDVHHMDYRNIVDVDRSCLVPLCRDCHDMAHEAIKMGLLTKRHNRQSLSRITPALLRSERKKQRRIEALPFDLVRKIQNLDSNKKRRLFAKLRTGFLFNHEIENLTLPLSKHSIIRMF